MNRHRVAAAEQRLRRHPKR